MFLLDLNKSLFLSRVLPCTSTALKVALNVLCIYSLYIRSSLIRRIFGTNKVHFDTLLYEIIPFLFLLYSEGHIVASLKKLDAFHSISGSPQRYHSANIKLLDQLLKCLTDTFEDDQESLKATFTANMKPWPKNIDNEPGNQGCNMS